MTVIEKYMSQQDNVHIYRDAIAAEALRMFGDYIYASAARDYISYMSYKRGLRQKAQELGFQETYISRLAFRNKPDTPGMPYQYSVFIKLTHGRYNIQLGICVDKLGSGVCDTEITYLWAKAQ